MSVDPTSAKVIRPLDVDYDAAVPVKSEDWKPCF